MIDQNFIKLKDLFLAKQLPHALLLDASTANCFSLAQDFSQWLLCETKIMQRICNNCSSCKLFVHSNHPDYLSIDLGKENEIKVDHIRSVNEFSSSMPYLAKCKVVLINNVHTMNLQASNAFLKTLEEPPANQVVIFIMLTRNYKLLPATILSRVVKFESFDSTGLIQQNNTLMQAVLQDLYHLWITQEINLINLVIKWHKMDSKQLVDSLWFIMVGIIKGEQHELLVEIRKKINPMVAWILLDSLNYLNKLVVLGYPINLRLFWYNFCITSITGDNIYADRART